MEWWENRTGQRRCSIYRPWEAKNKFSLESSTIFCIFQCCNMTGLLGTKNHRFGSRFGGQVGHGRGV